MEYIHACRLWTDTNRLGILDLEEIPLQISLLILQKKACLTLGNSVPIKIR